MKQLMTAYQDQLQQLGWEGLGLKPCRTRAPGRGTSWPGRSPRPKAARSAIPRPTEHVEQDQACAGHRDADRSSTRRGSTTRSASVATRPAGTRSEFFPYVGGFDSLEKTPAAGRQQCENCHGPRPRHVAAENGGPQEPGKIEAERQALKLTVAWPGTTCAPSATTTTTAPTSAARTPRARQLRHALLAESRAQGQAVAGAA